MPELTFRPLTARDVEAVHVLHGDPATNIHNPYGPSPDEASSTEMLLDWVQHWRQCGFEYELAYEGDQLAGIGGARRDVWRETDVVNLYWRLLPSFQGGALPTSWAAERSMSRRRARTGDMIVARMRPENSGSARVAEALGFHRRTDLDGAHDGVHWIIFAETPAGSPSGQAV